MQVHRLHYNKRINNQKETEVLRKYTKRAQREVKEKNKKETKRPTHQPSSTTDPNQKSIDNKFSLVILLISNGHLLTEWKKVKYFSFSLFREKTNTT